MTYKITLNETEVVVHEAVAGPQGATGSAGVVSATDPITYNSTTKDVGFNATGFVKTAIANTFTVGAQIIKTGADAVKGLTLTRNSSSQSANLLSVTNSDGTTELARIRPSGQLGVGGVITNSMLALNADLVGDNRGIVIKAGISSPTNNAIEILPLANNTPLMKVDASGIVTAPSFVGDVIGGVTGNVTGNLTGNVTGDVSGNAGTVTNGIYTTTTSLPNVTSVRGSTIPASANILSSSAYRQSQHTPSGSVDIVPRYQVNSTRTLTSGTIYFTGFTPIADMTVTKISAVITAVVGATNIQYGIFGISGTTLTALAPTQTPGSVTTGLSELNLTSAGYDLTAGTNYAIAFTCWGGTSATIAGTTCQASLVLQGNGTSGSVLAPLLAGISSGTTYTGIPSPGSTVALSSGNTSAFGFARLN